MEDPSTFFNTFKSYLLLYNLDASESNAKKVAVFHLHLPASSALVQCAVSLRRVNENLETHWVDSVLDKYVNLKPSPSSRAWTVQTDEADTWLPHWGLSPCNTHRERTMIGQVQQRHPPEVCLWLAPTPPIICQSPWACWSLGHPHRDANWWGLLAIAWEVPLWNLRQQHPWHQ